MNPELIFRIVCFLFVAVVMIRNTWVGDDAFITLRVVDNFLRGLGLVWNGGERVQVFTSPLWTLLLIPTHALIRDPFVALYTLSLVVSLLSFGFVLIYFAKGLQAMLALTLLAV